MTWWTPVVTGEDEPNRSIAIPWRLKEPPTQEQHREALVARMDELILASPKTGRAAVEDEFKSICSMEERRHWAYHIGLSPQMGFLLAQVDLEALSEKFVIDQEEDAPTLQDYVLFLEIF